MTSHLIGTDEAGYGPNLGPLVISATHWKLPAELDSDSLWQTLAGAVSQEGPDDGRLYVADSKAVYSPGRGLAELERSVLSLLGVLGTVPATLTELRTQVGGWRASTHDEFAAAWYAVENVALPVTISKSEVDLGIERLTTALAQSGVQLLAIRSDILSEPRFNRLTDAAGTKGAVLTESTLTLAGSLLRGREIAPALVLCDKHGGRNRYAAVLNHLADDGLVQTLVESRDRSAYRLGSVEFRFETRAERYLPVAVASMVSKYVREVSMLAFNNFWQRHQSDLQPTKGYPQDAVRFRSDIAAAQLRLGIPDDMLWRRR